MKNKEFLGGRLEEIRHIIRTMKQTGVNNLEVVDRDYRLLIKRSPPEKPAETK